MSADDYEGDLPSLSLTRSPRQPLRCKYCGKAITFKDRIPYEDGGRGEKHHCPNAVSTKRYKCFKCNASVLFENKHLVDAPGVPHQCQHRENTGDIDQETGEIFGVIDTQPPHVDSAMRNEIAIRAMQSLLAREFTKDERGRPFVVWVAEFSYEMADEMLKASAMP